MHFEKAKLESTPEAPEFSLDNDEDWQGVIDDMLGDEDEPEDDDGRYDAWA